MSEEDKGPVPWSMLEKFGLWGVLAYLVVTNSIATNNANTQFFQDKFVSSLEACATALSTAAVAMQSKDDLIEDNTKALEKAASQIDQLVDRVNRLLTRGWAESGANSKPPFVATPVSSVQ